MVSVKTIRSGRSMLGKTQLARRVRLAERMLGRFGEVEKLYSCEYKRSISAGTVATAPHVFVILRLKEEKAASVFGKAALKILPAEVVGPEVYGEARYRERIRPEFYQIGNCRVEDYTDGPIRIPHSIGTGHTFSEIPRRKERVIAGYDEPDRKMARNRAFDSLAKIIRDQIGRT